jgi:RNA polymerase sigma-70 factor, ECF subfamily
VHRAHRVRMLARARAVLGDRESAEDAVQEAFLRAWRACGSFDPTAGPSLASWLLTITNNVAIDALRARAARPRSADGGWDAADEPAAAAGTDAVLLRMVLLDALAGISDAHRGVVFHAVVRDRPYADVADELDLPVGTVKSRVFHALRGLRGALDRTALAA